jgi:hypothetical protein
MNSVRAPLLSLAHVTVMRGDRAALYHINLEIACGEHVGVLSTRAGRVLDFHIGAGAVGYF